MVLMFRVSCGYSLVVEWYISWQSPDPQRNTLSVKVEQVKFHFLASFCEGSCPKGFLSSCRPATSHPRLSEVPWLRIFPKS